MSLREADYVLDLSLPAQVHIGPGKIGLLGKVCAGLGKRCLLVTGDSSLERAGRLSRIERSLAEAGVGATRVAVPGEPDTAAVDWAAAEGRKAKCDLVAAIGGGSALDLGKAVAGMIPNQGEMADYLEGVGKGVVMISSPLPFVAAPTTAGTGSEATKNAVISGPGFKKSFRDARLTPAAAIVDAELTIPMPPEMTAACGMDALTQLIEAVTSLRASPLISSVALSGLKAAGQALPVAFARGDDLPARAGMAYASFLSGVALSNCGLGAVHGLASPLGALFPVPHSAACARLLPIVTRANHAALAAGRGEKSALQAYRRAEEALGRSIGDFCAAFKFPGLSSFGMTEEAIPKVVEGATGGSIKSNPVELTGEELAGILREAL